MRKISNLFLLCALMLVSAVTAYAQTPVGYQVSDAPQNGIFVENTHWFIFPQNLYYRANWSRVNIYSVALPFTCLLGQEK